LQELTPDLVQSKMSGATVLITGGTGSFGSTMARFLLNNMPGVEEIRIFSRDENKQDDMRRNLNSSKVKFYLGDVRDSQSITTACKGSNYIFHAAALKQVPSTEFFPSQAISTNILGSINTIEAALTCGVGSVVCLSSDKAVYPINAMGMTKALMEKIAQSYSRVNKKNNNCIVSITRYGNVMMSRGSIIPLLVTQALSGKKLTITDPNMTRFLMSLDESVDLVLNAFINAEPGDLFVRKSPASSIGNLATAIQEICKSNSADTEVIGIRHGEKLFETLVGSEEMAHSEENGDYFRIKIDSRDLNYSDYFQSRRKLPMTRGNAYTSDNTSQLSVNEIKELLLNTSGFSEMLVNAQ